MLRFFFTFIYLASLSINTYAFESSFRLGVGSIYLHPDLNTHFSLNDNALNGFSANLDNIQKTVLFTTYDFTSELSISTMLATPIEANIELQTPLAKIDAIEFDALPLTLAFQYSPKQLRWQNIAPFFGIAPLYLWIKDEQLTRDFNNLAAQGFGLNNGKLSMESQWSILYQAGVDYHLNNNVRIRAMAMYFDGDMTSNVNFDDQQNLSIDIDYKIPVYSISIEYRL